MLPSPGAVQLMYAPLIGIGINPIESIPFSHLVKAYMCVYMYTCMDYQSFIYTVCRYSVHMYMNRVKTSFINVHCMSQYH